MAREIFRNPHVRSALAYPFGDVLSLDSTNRARAAISMCPRYAPTPLRILRPVARRATVRGVYYKDEASRLGLGSFKALGGAYAVALRLQRIVEARVGRFASCIELVRGVYRDICARQTFATATDGNHGRSVAAAAQVFGAKSVIFLHAGVSAERERSIRAFGAETVRIQGNYDDSVREAARVAKERKWELISDTATVEDEPVAKSVMQGYTVMIAEALEQLSELGVAPSHVFVQGGVGALAGAVCAHTWEALRPASPVITVVEPDRADCLYQSARHGRPTPASGNQNTVMAGLACGEVSRTAWPIVAEAVEFFMTIEDSQAVALMRELADPMWAGTRIVAGESATAGLAGFLEVAAQDDKRKAMRIDEKSEILVFGTEGATDPLLYATLTGHVADEAPKE